MGTFHNSNLLLAQRPYLLTAISPVKKTVQRSMGVSPMSLRGVSPLESAGITGKMPVRLMGETPMLLFQRAAMVCRAATP